MCDKLIKRVMVLSHHFVGMRCPIRATVAACLLAFTLQASAATILVQAPSVVALGQNVPVRIDFQDVVDLYAFQLDVQFDPAVLQLISVTEGPFLQQAGSTQFVAGAIDNASGLLSFLSNTLTGPLSGQTGSGTVVILTFSAAGTGMSEIAVLNPIVLNSSLDDIP